MLSGHPGISPWVASPRGPKEGHNIRGWTVKTVTIAKSDKVYYSIFGRSDQKLSSPENLFIRMAEGAPPIPMERLQKWEYSESSSSVVAMAPSSQLLLVTVSLEEKEGKSLQAGYKHSAALSSCLNICWPTCICLQCSSTGK